MKYIENQNKKFETLIDKLNNIFIEHSLDWKEYIAGFKEYQKLHNDRRITLYPYNRIQNVSLIVFEKKTVPRDIESLRIIYEYIKETLDVELPTDAFKNPLMYIINHIIDAFSIILLILTSYFVIGGLLTGNGQLFTDHSPLISLLAFVILLLLLASYEGLQISVTTLRLKDVSAFKEDFGYACSTHKDFKDEDDTRRFLAGRQLFVILIVFFIARLTSFPTMTKFPFTDIDFPSWTEPWLTTFFLEYGVLGALFVLWLGQLAPQFIANKHPLGILNIPGMKFILYLAFFVESIGLTSPGKWLSNMVEKYDEIPISKKERYKNNVEKIQGYGTIGMKKIWKIGYEKASLQYQTTSKFYQEGFNTYIDDSLETSSIPLSTKWDYNLVNPDKNPQRQAIDVFHCVEPVYNHPHDDEPSIDNWRRYKVTLESKIGTFLPGEVLSVDTFADFEREGMIADGISINFPVKYLLFRAVFLDEPFKLTNTVVRVYKDDQTVEKSKIIRTENMEIQYDDDDNPFIEFMDWYPEQNNYYEFQWEVDYHSSH